MIYGYARISSKDQKLDTQIEELENFGVDEIVTETITGISKKKDLLDNLLASLQPLDTLVFTRMDRAGRNTLQLLQLVEELQERQINLVIMNMGIDTRTATGKFFLTIMAGMSELDRTMIKERQRNGIALAKKKGLYRGRKKKYTTDHPGMNHAIELRKTTFKTVKEICSITGVSEASFYRRWSELMKEKKIIKILKNKARCKRCDDVIESKHSHDFVTCKCGAISLDGGLEYQRLSFKNSIDDYDFSLSEYEEIEPEPKKEK